MPLFSGGDKLRDQVMLTAKTNLGVMGYFGNVVEIRWSGDRDHVDLDFDGNRKGFLSLSIRGSKNSGDIEVDWAKTATNSVEIMKVWRIMPSEDKQPLWSAPASVTH